MIKCLWCECETSRAEAGQPSKQRGVRCCIASLIWVRLDLRLDPACCCVVAEHVIKLLSSHTSYNGIMEYLLVRGGRVTLILLLPISAVTFLFTELTAMIEVLCQIF